MAEVQPLECLCRRGAGQHGFPTVPFHQLHLHQMSYESGDGLPPEPQISLEGGRFIGSLDPAMRTSALRSFWLKGILFNLIKYV